MILKEEKYLKYNIIEFESVDSTMNVIKNYPFNTIINSKEQTSGKGKGNRTWNSENNGNLYPTIKIEIENNKLNYNNLVFLVNIALRESIEKYNKTNNNIISKWPNDILINNKKVSGTLLEKDNNSLIIGTGININSYPQNTLFSATSLKENNIIVDKYELLKEYIKNFDYYFNLWKNNNFDIIREKFLNKCYKLHQKIKVNNLEGIFEDLDKDGTLILKLNNNQKYYVKSGDIF